MALHLKKFDPSREFVTAAAFRAAGVAWGKGFPFEKDSVNERTLKLLYEQRKLVYADSDLASKLLTRTHVAADRAAMSSAANTSRPAKALQDNPDVVDEAQTKADAEDKAVDKLVKGNSHAQLLKKASGIAGVKQNHKKADIARALVRHGRAE